MIKREITIAWFAGENTNKKDVESKEVESSIDR